MFEIAVGSATSINESDADLKRRVDNYLLSRHVFALRTLHVDAEHGVVTLRGRVHSFHERQIAVHSAQRVAGVLRVIDELEVVARPVPNAPPSPRLVFSPDLVDYFARRQGNPQPTSAPAA